MWRRYAVLMLGVIACSTAVVFIKASAVDPVRMAAYRLLIAAVALTPLFLRDLAAHRGGFAFSEVRKSFWPGVLLGIHFITWIVGVRMTSATNSSLIVNLTPAILPLFSFFIARERLNRAEILGTVIALAGALLLTADDFRVSRASFAGDMMSLLSMVFFAWYLALGRVNRGTPTVWLYLVPLYYIAGLVCLPFGLARPETQGLAWWPREILLMLALGLIPTVVGHSALNWAVRHVAPQTVSLVNLSQFMFSGVQAWTIFGEVPRPLFYAACVLMIAGAAVAIRATPAAGAARREAAPAGAEPP